MIRMLATCRRAGRSVHDQANSYVTGGTLSLALVSMPRLAAALSRSAAHYIGLAERSLIFPAPISNRCFAAGCFGPGKPGDDGDGFTKHVGKWLRSAS
jgi:hypothetical protein